MITEEFVVSADYPSGVVIEWRFITSSSCGRVGWMCQTIASPLMQNATAVTQPSIALLQSRRFDASDKST